ncbi:hypothetical protein BOTBODRAFT_179246 [Botryobasidium botryosum FD-172 SS1]|uniref:Uncharacterized protein n=1 Tax=Botryobasidium botryosum (strain FD-172 SS1) TaxID=930990 RepID=A0A067M3E2_BOTB1|nr:hypothetical protein BOTBODRAFT_179246 [Botryobasidium botryosum FD-172 SS1]
MAPAQPLSPNAQRLRTIIVTGPLLFVTTYLLYKRLYLGEQQRRIPERGTMLEDIKKANETERGRG